MITRILEESIRNKLGQDKAIGNWQLMSLNGIQRESPKFQKHLPTVTRTLHSMLSREIM